MNGIICLKCINSVRTANGNYNVTFLEDGKIKYQIDIHDSIPIDTIINLNSYYHDFTSNGDVTTIRVKQKFKGNQPESLELETLQIIALEYVFIVIFIDTTTDEKFRLKVAKVSSSVGTKTILDFKKNAMLINCRPHFHKKYSIENWIFSGIEI